MFRTLPTHEEMFGLPYPIVLINAAQEELDENGNVVGMHIPNMEGLVAAIAVTRCLIPVRLDGSEVKFIRKVIGKTSKQFAEDLELEPATFSRWENGKQTVGAWADKQVRQAAIILLREAVPHLSLDPRDVVGLRFAPCGVESIPAIEMSLQCEGEAAEVSPGCWDTNYKLAA